MIHFEDLNADCGGPKHSWKQKIQWRNHNFSESLAPNKFADKSNRMRRGFQKNRAERGLFFAVPPAIFWKRDISSASEKTFPGFWGYLLNSLQKRGVLVHSIHSLRNYTTMHLGLWSAGSEKLSVRLQVVWAQVSARFCWWLVNRVTQT